MTLSANQKKALITLLMRLVDQEQAHIIVPANAEQPGYWFGGGNVVQDDAGAIWLSGRYRDYGDSRTGLGAGTRGLECAVFRSDDGGQTAVKVHSWSKADLSRNGRVLSVEGTGLHRRGDGTWELFLALEKERAYPELFTSYQKPGTGVWSIERLTGPTLEHLTVDTLEPVLSTDLPGYLHIKDPVPFDAPGGETALIFCTHPISWASCNTALALSSGPGAALTVSTWEMVPRGPIWDVASTRITDRLVIPPVGMFADKRVAVYFYDGAECMRAHEENPRAHKRPRGYSCEEIGGAFWGPADRLDCLERISLTAPLFTSPHGTGSSRYVSCLDTGEGILTTWQQAQPDGSQPLVANFVSREDIAQILSV